MSTYQAMWLKINELSLSETKDWINVLTPAKGIGVDFRGVRVTDIDVLEALRFYEYDLEKQILYPIRLGPNLNLVCEKCNYDMHYCAGCGDDLTHNEEHGQNGSSHPCYHDAEFRRREYGF